MMTAYISSFYFREISNKKKPYRNQMCAEFTIKPKKCQIKYTFQPFIEKYFEFQTRLNSYIQLAVAHVLQGSKIYY